MGKKIAKWVGLLLLVVLVGAGAFVGIEVTLYNASMDKVYDIQPLAITASQDPNVIARGKHLAESIAGCAMHDCHGTDLGGGKLTEAKGLMSFAPPNLTVLRLAYSDGELARLVRHGVKKDGRSVVMMPAQEFGWLSDADVTAVISYVRSVPAIERPNGSVSLTVMAKVLDRLGPIPLDAARRANVRAWSPPPAPSPTAEYGAYIGRLCSGCHAETYAGGHITGTPPDFPIPLNLTAHETGLKGWTFDDFDTLIRTAKRKNGKALDPFMPVEALQHMDDVEKRALWAYLQSLPPTPFGERDK